MIETINGYSLISFENARTLVGELPTKSILLQSPQPGYLYSWNALSLIKNFAAPLATMLRAEPSQTVMGLLCELAGETVPRPFTGLCPDRVMKRTGLRDCMGRFTSTSRAVDYLMLRNSLKLIDRWGDKPYVKNEIQDMIGRTPLGWTTLVTEEQMGATHEDLAKLVEKHAEELFK